jgi:hypothetical protein
MVIDRSISHPPGGRGNTRVSQLVLETMGLRVIRTTWVEATTKPGVVQRKVAEALRAPFAQG